MKLLQRYESVYIPFTLHYIHLVSKSSTLINPTDTDFVSLAQVFIESAA